MSFNKNIIAVSVLNLTIIAGANAAPWSASVTKTAIKTGLTRTEVAIGTQLETTTNKNILTVMDNTAKITEAIRTAVNQEAVATNQVADADKKARQVFAATLLTNSQLKEQTDIIAKFSTKTGQGYAACKVLAENTQLGQVIDSVPAQTAIKVNALDNAPGTLVDSVEASLDKRNSIHKDNFCTESEQERGQCKVSNNGLAQGADTNANTLFISAKQSSVIGFAKSAVRQNILGTPDVALPANIGKTAQGQAYLLAYNQKAALSAFPAYSLAYLESMSEVRDDIKDSNGKPSSPNDMLFNTVTRYFGGKDSNAWQKSMVAQQPRGVLVEMAKMEGLGAWMDYQELVGGQRMEGEVAAMTIAATLPIQSRLDAQYSSIERNSVRDKIMR